MNNPEKDKNGNLRWYNEKGQLHREDGPAEIVSNGGCYWCINGKLHRENGPAVECTSGHKEWWVNNKLHREDGPAVEWENGYKQWWVDGVFVKDSNEKS